jgi:hypothetical protein
MGNEAQIVQNQFISRSIVACVEALEIFIFLFRGEWGRKFVGRRNTQNKVINVKNY